MAEPAGHDLVDRPVTTIDQGVYEKPTEATAFDRDRAIARVFDEMVEHLVAQSQEQLLAVHRLAEAEQTWSNR